MLILPQSKKGIGFLFEVRAVLSDFTAKLRCKWEGDLAAQKHLQRPSLGVPARGHSSIYALHPPERGREIRGCLWDSGIAANGEQNSKHHRRVCKTTACWAGRCRVSARRVALALGRPTWNSLTYFDVSITLYRSYVVYMPIC